ncbi:ABC transporter substrate-binding protein [Agrobacterium rhizogenes]|uniref:extracellular solute-binding protein n=1 Tax=Rhizobium rhizogenes TaxID=359 RepID=UPI001572651B|nr:extracellular solute-binding protein [Rhizobium rhizogenes]NTG72003.1 ABC transporter substrate-binding protein [Rhizobium rhizogenes]NTI73006.1 ABC transporter substrate-binding protein [Rhizobium rhizogenes]
MALSRLKAGLVVSLFCLLALPAPSNADEPQFRIGTAILGDLKYQPGFKHFDYVNPDAPKGGELKLSNEGTFDTLNPVLLKGNPATGLPMVFDTLMKSSNDEMASSYGLLAESVTYPDDISSATFRLRAEAKWADGTPVTPDDVVFSFDRTKELNPFATSIYSHVTRAEKTGDGDVTFYFDEKNNRELPYIAGQLEIVPKHWWESVGPDGKPRDISRTTLEPVMGSGPYKIAAVQPGSSIRYELRDDYWGKNLPVNVGENNFGAISYTYYADKDVEFEAFRGGNTDFWQDQSASHWVTAYDFPAAKDGRIKREELPNSLRSVGIMQAMVLNLRRDQFKDQRVREALNYAYDFEEMNRALAFGQLTRVNTFFFGTELASSGLPTGEELNILNSVKDKVPPEVFTTPYTNPVGGDPQKARNNLRKAVELFKEAGYVLKGNRMINEKTGQPFTMEILLGSPSQERSNLPYVQNLRRIGIDATLRTVDSSQYINRIRSFDYDATWNVWGTALPPGSEQIDYWGSASANRQGSRNYAGISDPGVDALIGKLVSAATLEEKTAAAKALDRVLLAHHYLVPLFYGTTNKIAYWDKMAHPSALPYYSIGFPDLWWSKSAAK